MAMLRAWSNALSWPTHAILNLLVTGRCWGALWPRRFLDAVEQGYLNLLDSVFQSGKPYTAIGSKYAVQTVPGGATDDRYVDFVFQPIVDSSNQVLGIFVQRR